MSRMNSILGLLGSNDQEEDEQQHHQPTSTPPPPPSISSSKSVDIFHQLVEEGNSSDRDAQEEEEKRVGGENTEMLTEQWDDDDHDDSLETKAVAVIPKHIDVARFESLLEQEQSLKGGEDVAQPTFIESDLSKIQADWKATYEKLCIEIASKADGDPVPRKRKKRGRQPRKPRDNSAKTQDLELSLERNISTLNALVENQGNTMALSIGQLAVELMANMDEVDQSQLGGTDPAIKSEQAGDDPMKVDTVDERLPIKLELRTSYMLLISLVSRCLAFLELEKIKCAEFIQQILDSVLYTGTHSLGKHVFSELLKELVATHPLLLVEQLWNRCLTEKLGLNDTDGSSSSIIKKESQESPKHKPQAEKSTLSKCAVCLATLETLVHSYSSEWRTIVMKSVQSMSNDTKLHWLCCLVKELKSLDSGVEKSVVWKSFLESLVSSVVLTDIVLSEDFPLLDTFAFLESVHRGGDDASEHSKGYPQGYPKGHLKGYPKSHPGDLCFSLIEHIVTSNSTLKEEKHCPSSTPFDSTIQYLKDTEFVLTHVLLPRLSHISSTYLQCSTEGCSRKRWRTLVTLVCARAKKCHETTARAVVYALRFEGVMNASASGVLVGLWRELCEDLLANHVSLRQTTSLLLDELNRVAEQSVRRQLIQYLSVVLTACSSFNSVELNSRITAKDWNRVVDMCRGQFGNEMSIELLQLLQRCKYPSRAFVDIFTTMRSLFAFYVTTLRQYVQSRQQQQRQQQQRQQQQQKHKTTHNKESFSSPPCTTTHEESLLGLLELVRGLLLDLTSNFMHETLTLHAFTALQSFLFGLEFSPWSFCTFSEEVHEDMNFFFRTSENSYSAERNQFRPANQVAAGHFILEPSTRTDHEHPHESIISMLRSQTGVLPGLSTTSDRRCEDLTARCSGGIILPSEHQKTVDKHQKTLFHEAHLASVHLNSLFEELIDIANRDRFSSLSEENHFVYKQLRCGTFETAVLLLTDRLVVASPLIPSDEQYKEILPCRSAFEWDLHVEQWLFKAPSILQHFVSLSEYYAKNEDLHDTIHASSLLPVVKSALVILIGYFHTSDKSSSEKHLPISMQRKNQLRMAVCILQILAKLEWVPPPLCFTHELLPSLPPQDIRAMLMTIWMYVVDYPPSPENVMKTKAKSGGDSIGGESQDGVLTHNLRMEKYLRPVRSIFQQNMHSIGYLYGQFFKRMPTIAPIQAQ